MMTPAERFWAKVNKTDECWEWTGATNANGYGVIHGSVRLAHRLSVLLDGRDPTKGVVRHACDNRRCVRPSHLTVGTQRENLKEAAARGRLGKRALTAVQVMDLRRWYADGMSQKALAAHFQISQASVSRYINKFHENYIPRAA